MNRDIVIEYYGSQSAAARALGLTRQAVQAWQDPIPPANALELDFITDGKLPFVKEVYFRAWFRNQEDDNFI